MKMKKELKTVWDLISFLLFYLFFPFQSFCRVFNFLSTKRGKYWNLNVFLLFIAIIQMIFRNSNFCLFSKNWILIFLQRISNYKLVDLYDDIMKNL